MPQYRRYFSELRVAYLLEDIVLVPDSAACGGSTLKTCQNRKTCAKFSQRPSFQAFSALNDSFSPPSCPARKLSHDDLVSSLRKTPSFKNKQLRGPSSSASSPNLTKEETYRSKSGFSYRRRTTSDSMSGFYAEVTPQRARRCDIAHEERTSASAPQRRRSHTTTTIGAGRQSCENARWESDSCSNRLNDDQKNNTRLLVTASLAASRRLSLGRNDDSEEVAGVVVKEKQFGELLTLIEQAHDAIMA